MRVTFTLLLCFVLTCTALAQPSNDDCATPTALSLTTPSPCPSSTPTTDVFQLTNIDATPTTPYPSLLSCDGDGELDGPAAEVWVSFTPQSHNTIFQITGGLSTPNFVIYEGADCNFLQAIACGSASPNAGTITSTFSLSIGDPYFMMISGGDVNDQGDFTLTITNQNDCGACLTSVSLDPIPPPTNGTYSSGQSVTFCFTVNDWDVQGSIEWLHAITIDFGPGWDINSIFPSPPASCDGNGSWGWYDSWVGCNTGETFGPGFAYESSAGIDNSPNCNTGGSPDDGDPGNNWGDGGGGCSTLPEPVTFCWLVSVSDCPPNFTENDLNISVQVWSDGDSGSWSQTGCNSGVTFNSLASSICCDDLDPIGGFAPASCPGENDATLFIQGGGGIDPNALYNFTMLDDSGQVVFTCDACSGEVVMTNLLAGFYAVNVQNVVTGCVRSVNVNIPPPTFPLSNIIDDLPACLGDEVTFTANLLLCDQCPPPPIGNTLTYDWTGPNGFTANTQTIVITEPGVYTVSAFNEGCPADPVSIEYIPSQVEVGITSDFPAVCEGDPVSFTATGGISYSWLNITTGEISGDINPYTTAITNSPTVVEVTSYNADGCPAVNQMEVTILPPPVLSDTMFGSFCDGSQLFVLMLGADSFFWPDSGGSDNPRTFVLGPGTYQYDVTGTSFLTGCSTDYTIEFEILEAPSPTVDPNNATICIGDDITLNAIGGNNSVYNWSNGEMDTQSITVSPTEDTYYTVIEWEGECFGSYEILITVEEPLAAPAVSCGVITPASVEFTWPSVTGATGYDVVVLTGQSGTLNGSSFALDNLNPSETVTIEVTATGGMCGGITSTITCISESCPPVIVDVTPVNDLCLDPGLAPFPLEVLITDATMAGDTTWSGTGISDAANGIFDPLLADIGSHEIIMTYSEGLCNYRDTILINIFQTPTADFIADNDNICSTDSIIITYTGNAGNAANYVWNFDGGTAIPGTSTGPHNVSWVTGGDKTITLTVEEDNCTSAIFSQNITVDDPLSALSVICAPSTTTSVEFNWNDIPGAEGYMVNVLSGQTGTLSGTSFAVDNLQPLEVVTVEVIAQNSGACGDVSTEMTCAASACPAFGLDLNPVADICLTPNLATVTLSATVTGGDGNGTLSWSGTGITDAAGGIFNPVAAGAGTHTITLTYTEGPCTGNASMTITIFDTPTADFSLSTTPVCIGEPTTLTYTGSADPANAGFTWNFGGGNASPGTGAGPQDVSWPTAGDKTVTLIVTENGCTSEVFSQTVMVESPLSAPIINCNPSSTEITFTWDDVVSASGYNVTVLTGQTGTQNGNSFTLTGLTPLETVTIEVEAIGNGPCGNSTAQESCVAEDCPDVLITITPVNPICFYAFTVPANLNATVTGGIGGGTESWDGSGIIDNTTGTFDPQVAGIGAHTINYTYNEGTCTYNSSITIIINAVPTASFTLDDPVCIDQTNNILFSGSAGGSATYDWNFDAGTINSGTNEGPYDVSWSTSGTKTVSLTVTENDCISEPYALDLEVTDPIADPVIDCESTDTSVIFSWLDVAGATGYQVAGPVGTMIGNTYEIFGLLPGTEVTITVTTETDNPCGNSSAIANCIASNCPDIFLNINAPAELCADDGIQILTANPLGGTGGGTGVWFGNGFADASTGAFNPALVAGQTISIQYIYTENVICVYDTAFDITIHTIPDASFTIDSPICEDGSAMAVFTGTAPAASTFNWNFGGGISNLPDTDAGPHDITWANSGTQTISLQLDNNGCLSPVFSQTVEVTATLENPVVSCDLSTTNSVTFMWDPVVGATGYEIMDIDGPAGTLSGTTYTVTGLTPEQMVTIEVTALSAGICNNTSTVFSCQAMACPMVTVEVTGPDAICVDNSAAFDFTINGSSDNFEITYSLNNGTPENININTSGSLDFNQLTETTTIEILSFTNIDSPECSYPGASEWSIAVNGPPNTGAALTAPHFCRNTTASVNLAELLNGADAGGVWTETSDINSLPGGFDATQGTFDISGQPDGTYKFTYMIDAPEPCPDDQTEVSVIIDPLPVADAGADQIIFCNLGLVSLNGSGSSSGNNVTYLWTAPSGVNITNPNDLLIDVSQEGSYTLEVTNEFGCTETDIVEVSLDDDVPVGDLVLSEISCFEANDGAIFIENVTGGSPPYVYAFNGGAFSSQSTFTGLGPDSYALIIQDVNGCFSELSIDLTEPSELVVNLLTNLPGDPTIEFGDSIQLDVVFQSDNPIDTIIWVPDAIAKESETSVVVTPTVTTTFSVTVIDVNGCRDSDNLTVYVKKTRPVFIPNAFSPNDDGINDILYINTGNPVTKIKSFVIFNRWGEVVFESYGFPPNTPAFGWDGKFRGKFMNPAVFTYFAEIEFIDGEVILFKGDVSLVR